MKKIILSLAIAMSGYSSYAQWTINSATNDGYNNNSSGKIGIGTSNPAYLLQLSSFAPRTRLGIDNLNSSGSRSSAINFTYNNGNTSAWELGNDIEANGTQSFYLYDNIAAAVRLYFNTLGNVGIGTTSPTQLLTMPITSNGNGISLGTYSSLSAGNFAFIGITGADGTFNSGNLTGNDNGSAGMALVHTNGGLGSTELAFVTHNNGTDSRKRLRIDRFGNIGIGTTTPDAKLAVKGTVHTQEVKVDMVGWNDFVFDKAYRIPTLSSVKNYIDQNHHLPEIPSEAEVIKNGVNVGEMLKLQTKKIEELTLYLIELQKQNLDLKKELIKTKKRNHLK